jgi:8-oxo-dGTP diphosphatase
MLRSGCGVKNIPTEIPVVALALIDEAGRVLMQERRAGGRHGGLWEFPGGKLEPGESPESALVREIAEELGIALERSALRFVARSTLTDEPHVLMLYTARAWRGAPRCLDGEAIGWFTAAEAARLTVPPLDVPLVARLGEWAQGIAKPNPRTYVRPSTRP